VTTLTPKDRLSWSGRIFQIISVLNTDSRNRELQGVAKELAK
jgi:hypothetical protein